MTCMLYLLEIEYEKLDYRYPCRDLRFTDGQCEIVSQSSFKSRLWIVR